MGTFDVHVWKTGLCKFKKAISMPYMTWVIHNLRFDDAKKSKPKTIFSEKIAVLLQNTAYSVWEYCENYILFWFTYFEYTGNHFTFISYLIWYKTGIIE